MANGAFTTNRGAADVAVGAGAGVSVGAAGVSVAGAGAGGAAMVATGEFTAAGCVFSVVLPPLSWAPVTGVGVKVG